MNDNINHAFEAAKAWADEIVQWCNYSQRWLNYSKAERNELDDPDDIKPEPLSVLVRSDWHTPGIEASKACEYELLLATGGPAVRLIGSLDEHGEAETVTLQCQDWFTKWINVPCDDEINEALQAYVATFYFGE